MKPRLLFVVGVLFGLVSSATAQPVVRVTVAQKPPLLVGQQVRIDVQVFVPNFFMGAPQFPTLAIPGAVTTLSDDAVNLNETIKGEAYAGIQRSYLFVASTAGGYTLPAASVRVTYAAVPGQPPATLGVPLPRVDLNLEWPAGMSPEDARDGMLVARVTVQQHLDRTDLALRVGDALTRTLDVTVDKTAAMFIPPPSFDAPAGIQIYPRDPVLRNDAGGRGALIAGHRMDAAVYVFQRAGTFELPAIDFAWYDIAAKRSRTATAAAITVTVAPSSSTASIAPEAEAPPPPAPRRSDWRRIAIIAATIVLGLGLGWWLRLRLPLWLRRYAGQRARAAQAQPARFARFERACRRGKPAEAYAALVEWMRTREAGTTRDWRRTGQAGFDEQVRVLEQALFATATAPVSWDGRELATAATQLRAVRPHASSHDRPGRSLCPLNPEAAD